MTTIQVPVQARKYQGVPKKLRMWLFKSRIWWLLDCGILKREVHVRIGKFTFVLMLALFAYQLDCIMSCTAEAATLTSSNGSHSMPACPCHRNQRDSRNSTPCVHQSIYVSASSPAIIHHQSRTLAGLSFAFASSPDRFPARQDTPSIGTNSPPGGIPPSFALRI